MPRGGFMSVKYFKLLRLQDQYIQAGFAIAAGVYLRTHEWRIILWALACTFISFVGFILNQRNDQKDVDQYSWNPVHLKKNDTFDQRAIVLMIGAFSVLGLWLSWLVGLFWWSVGTLSLAVAYSQEPIRFKRRFALDILAQLGVWFVIPFIAPLWGVVSQSEIVLLVVAFVGVSWCIFYPYQLADFIADAKAGFCSTHIVLGMEKSMWLGVVLGVVGTVVYFGAGFYVTVWWALPIIGIGLTALWQYRSWVAMSSISEQTASMIRHIPKVKFFTQLLLPYILILWFIL